MSPYTIHRCPVAVISKYGWDASFYPLSLSLHDSAASYPIQHNRTWLSIILPDCYMTQHDLTRLSIIFPDSAASYTTQHHLMRLSIISPDSASFHLTQHHLTLRPSIIWHDSASSHMTQQHLTSFNSCSSIRETASLFQVTNCWNLVRPKTEITVNQYTAKKTKNKTTGYWSSQWQGRVIKSEVKMSHVQKCLQ